MERHVPDSGSGSNAASKTVLEAMQQFIRYMKDEKQAAVLTLDAYERDLFKFANVVGNNTPVVEITAEHVRNHMYALIDRKLSQATVRRALYALGSFFSWAVKWEVVSRNPVAKVTIPKRERIRQVRALSKRERSMLIAAADELAKIARCKLDQHAPTMIRLMLKTGLRRSEVVSLAWDDVNFEAHEITVRRGKGNKLRRVPIEDKELLELLRGLQQNNATKTKPSTFVFPNTRGAKLSYSVFYKIFGRVMNMASLKDSGITPHSLRHTFGSVLCQRGVPVPFMSKTYLGMKILVQQWFMCIQHQLRCNKP